MSLGSNEIDLTNSRFGSKHNAIRFYPADAQIPNLQQLDVMVAGPDDANDLFVIDGQFDATLAIVLQGTDFAVAKETFNVLVGPSSLIDSSFEQLPQLRLQRLKWLTPRPGHSPGPGTS